MNKEFLYEMLKTCSVSGHEEELQKKVIHHMNETADDILSDYTGNVISVLNPLSETKVLLCGHIDEIGMIITSVQSDGSLKVTNTGGVRAVLYLGTQVQIKTKTGFVNGVVITNSSLIKRNDLSCTDLTIDIGASSKEEALKMVSVGDPVCAKTDVLELMNDRVAARAMDDRIGAFIVIETLIKAKKKGCQTGVYAATTTGEETSMRGAYWAASKVKPTCAIAVDVTFTSDYDGVNGTSTGEVELGKGPVLCLSSIVSKKMNALLEACAKDLNIPLQYEIAPGRTGTDADKIHFTNEGVPTALVSIPLRYMHSSVETLDLKDVEQIIDLLAEFVCRMNAEIDLHPLH
ncbi:MAG: M20/M25/M40 family metallo-hydrolase [Erysipelotrichaceae bacterium]|nr:M20/M25/M40 family metallo-hydrolase [Erysipelotrichaceae bacterium]